MLTLNTELTDQGMRLTFPQSVYLTGLKANDAYAGTLMRDFEAHSWQFKGPNGITGRKRRTLEAAQYDALAHWADTPITTASLGVTGK